MSYTINKRESLARFTALKVVARFNRKEPTQRRPLLSPLVESLEIRSLLSVPAIDWAAEARTHPTGLIEPSPAELAYDASHTLHPEAIKLTQLGLDRINESGTDGELTVQAANAGSGIAADGSDIIGTTGSQNDRSPIASASRGSRRRITIRS